MISSINRKLSPVFVCLCTIPFAASFALGQTVIATIPVAGFAGQGAADPITQKVYIPTGAGSDGIGQVTVIDEKTNTIAGIITVATDWQVVAVAWNPVKNLLYVGAENGGLFIVNPKTHATVGFINVNASSLAFNPATNKIYASDFNSNLYVIDAETGNIETTIAIQGIENIAVNPVTNRIYAAVQDFSPGAVAVVDGSTNQVIAQVPAGSGLTFGVAVDPIRNVFYSAEQFGTMTVYDGRTNTETTAVTIPGQPSGLSFDPITRLAYVSNYAANSVDIVNGATDEITGSVAVGNQPEYSTDDPFHKLLYVGTSSTNAQGEPVFALSVIKTN